MIPLNKTTMILIAITVITNIFAFAKDIVLSYFYGASTTTDIYLISITISTVLFSFLGNAVSTSYVPMFSNIKKSKGKLQAHRFTNNIINILLVVISSITIMGLIFTENLVKLFASGFHGEVLLTAVEYTRLSLFAGYFSVGILLFSAYLRLHNSFIIPAASGLLAHMTLILFIYISTMWNGYLIVFGFVLGILIQYMFLLHFAFRKGYKYKFLINFKDPYIKKTILIALPIILSTSISQINVLIDRTLASQIVSGGISSLTFANKINGFIQAIFVLTIAHIMYPLISKLAVNNKMMLFKERVVSSTSIICFFIIPATVGAMILSEPIIRALFGRGEFDERAVLMTSSALFFYSIGMIGIGVREILARAFYSLQDTKTPMINAGIAVILNIILNIILSKYMGISGLALATSISGLFSSTLMYLSLKKKIGSFELSELYISLGKIFISSIIMGLIVYFSYDLFSKFTNALLSLTLSIGLGVFIYLLISFILNIKKSTVMIKNALKR